MSQNPLDKVSSFKEKYKFGMDEDKKKLILSLDKDSIFLKNIINKKEKEKQRNKSSKIYKPVVLKKNEINSIKEKEKIFHGSLKEIAYYQSPLKSSRNGRINKELNGIKNLYINCEDNSNRNEYSYSKKNRINSPNYIKPVLRYTFNSPTNIGNRPNSLRNTVITEAEPNKYILNINGQKIFPTPSFTSLSSRNRVLSSSRLESELYRNYNELKLKGESINKRKNKKNKENNSEEQKIRKGKKIDEQVINIKYNNRKKVTKIVKDGKKDNVIKNNFMNKNKYYKNLIPLKTVQDNNSRNKLNKNFLYFKDKKSTDNIKTNINIIDKKINENTMNKRYNNYPNNICFSKNIYFSPKISKNNKTQLSSSNILKNGNYKNIKTPQQINGTIHRSNRVLVKKKFVEDHNSISFTGGKKLTIKIHCLRNCNQIFHKKAKTRQKLRIQKIMNIFLSKNIGLYLDYLINKNISIDFKKMKNDKLLSSIIEEEEKSKLE